MGSSGINARVHGDSSLESQVELTEIQTNKNLNVQISITNMDFHVGSTHDFLRLKTLISQNIKKLQQTPQQFNALATRIKNGESNTMQDVKSLVDNTREKTNQTQSLFKTFSDQSTDRYVTNKAQKRQDCNMFKNQIERALKDIENAERHVINTEKEALKEYNRTHQLVDFGDDDLSNPSGFGNSSTQQQTQASISRQQEMADRQRQMESIERDIDNVHMIYKELNQLVYEQGEQVDSIENHIDQAEREVEEGVQQLSQAAVHARSLRKKKLCLTMFGLAAAITLIFIIWISKR